MDSEDPVKDGILLHLIHVYKSGFMSIQYTTHLFCL